MAQTSDLNSSTGKNKISRRSFIAFLSAIGISDSLLAKFSWSEETSEDVTVEDLKVAEKLIGISFTEKDRQTMIDNVNENLQGYKNLRKIPLKNSVPPVLDFSPLRPGMTVDSEKDQFDYTRYPSLDLPENEQELVFLPVTHLSYLIRTRQIRSTDLTKIYLERLKKYDPILHCVITLTEELALKQAKKADQEIKVGHYRGPLHGIPWGAKDLFAVKGYPTTWGAVPFKNQTIDHDATIVQRLEESGAVLVAKLSLGALAWGDVWFDAKTRNPWNPEQGSSGSSAGSAAATAAGLVGFSLGTETYGSIISPSTRCGATGLRPTFGRVSRFGAMALSWSMDKIGPICRSVEDCALVFQAIHGPDGKDNTVSEYPFYWNPNRNLKELRIGYLKSLFEKDHPTKEFDQKALDVLRSMGFQLKTVELPDYPYGDMMIILNAEAAASFDEITRNRKIDQMVRQGKHTWPNSFRFSRFIPAVAYIQANRIRTLVIEEMAEIMKEVDVIVSPTFGGSTLALTNLTGHPAVVLPNGFREKGTPVSITFVGDLFKESDLLAVAKAYQDATEFHKKHPKL